ISLPKATNDHCLILSSKSRHEKGALPGCITVSSLTLAIKTIKEGYKLNHYKPVDVVLVGEGCGSMMQVGNDNLEDNNEAVRHFCKELRGEVKSVFLFGCEVARGSREDENHLMRSLARGLVCRGVPVVTVTGCTNCIMYCEGRVLRWKTSSYFQT